MTSSADRAAAGAGAPPRAGYNPPGFVITLEPIPSGANGTTNFTNRTVTVAEHFAPAQACKTLAHELGHVHLHDGTEYALGFFRVEWQPNTSRVTSETTLLRKQS